MPFGRQQQTYSEVGSFTADFVVGTISSNSFTDRTIPATAGPKIGDVIDYAIVAVSDAGGFEDTQINLAVLDNDGQIIIRFVNPTGGNIDFGTIRLNLVVKRPHVSTYLGSFGS